MRTYIGGHQAVNDFDFVELALGTPVELWLGVDGESEMERAARLDAARDILAERAVCELMSPLSSLERVGP